LYLGVRFAADAIVLELWSGVHFGDGIVGMKKSGVVESRLENIFWAGEWGNRQLQKVVRVVGVM